ncbi:MAG TPA: histidine kinase [Terriglobales bacterium]|nr:histidine kinase [Terriglobales bacterium]
MSLDVGRFSERAIEKIANSYIFAFAVWGAVCLLSIPEHKALLGAQAINSYYLEAMAVRFASIAILTPPVFYFAKRFAFSRARAWHSVPIYLLGCIVFNLIYSICRWAFAPLWNPSTQTFAARSLGSVVYSSFADVTLFYCAILLAGNASLYRDHSKDAATERALLRQALANSELDALTAKIRPHFLFNVLHGITTLMDNDVGRAKFMVLRLSTLLRTSLRYSSSDVVPLTEELNFVTAYLELERMRLGSRLRMEWHVEHATRPCLVPHLVLQQLIENAIVHGIESSRKGGYIDVITVRAAGFMYVTVKNSIGEKRNSGIGIGLASIRARLSNIYGEDAWLHFTVESEAIATMCVPALHYGELNANYSSDETDKVKAYRLGEG